MNFWYSAHCTDSVLNSFRPQVLTNRAGTPSGSPPQSPAMDPSGLPVTFSPASSCRPLSPVTIHHPKVAETTSPERSSSKSDASDRDACCDPDVCCSDASDRDGCSDILSPPKATQPSAGVQASEEVLSLSLRSSSLSCSTPGSKSVFEVELEGNVVEVQVLSPTVSEKQKKFAVGKGGGGENCRGEEGRIVGGELEGEGESGDEDVIVDEKGEERVGGEAKGTSSAAGISFSDEINNEATQQVFC